MNILSRIKATIFGSKEGYSIQDLLPVIAIFVVAAAFLGFGSVFLAQLGNQSVVSNSSQATANISYGQSGLNTIGQFLPLIGLAIVFGIALGVLLGMLGGALGGGQGRAR